MSSKKRPRITNPEPFLPLGCDASSSKKRNKKQKLVPSNVSSKFLKEALLVHKEIQRELQGSENDDGSGKENLSFVIRQAHQLKDFDLDAFDGFSVTESQFGHWNVEAEIDEEDEKLLEAFLSKDARPQCTLADIIAQKIKGNDAKASSGVRPVPKLRDSIIEEYKGVGKLLNKYTSGKMPKAFKHIPSLQLWEEVLYLTEPDKWSPNAMYEATKFFASNMGLNEVERFYELVLLPRVREDIRKNKRLNFALYQSLKNALHKPTAFNNGILFPLCQSRTCTLREAVIVGSIIEKISIRPMAFNAALSRLAGMKYYGTTSYFIKLLIEKKYELRYSVLHALVYHFMKSSKDSRVMPVIWHQSLLAFVQRYKNELKKKEKTNLSILVERQRQKLETMSNQQSRKDKGCFEFQLQYSRRGKTSNVARQLDLGDSDGLRHTRSQKVNASVHRQDPERMQQQDAAQEDEVADQQHRQDPERMQQQDAAQEDEVADQLTDEPIEADYVMEGENAYTDEYETDAYTDDNEEVEYRITRGPGGRFQSVGSTSGTGVNKHAKSSADDSWIVKEPQPGGPMDGTVIPSFLGHVASKFYLGHYRDALNCQNRFGVCQRLRAKYISMPVEAKELISGTGLEHLAETMFSHVDHVLVSAFVERWQPDTNTFHLPFGEMTIMLHDVFQILRVPVEGELVSAQLSIKQQKGMCSEVMALDEEELVKLWKSGSVATEEIESHCFGKRIAQTQAIAWTWILLEATLFVDKSGDMTCPSCLWELKDDLEGVERYSWGAAVLAYLYRQLGMASRGDCSGIAGCLTLLQAWIYEYFPCFRPSRERGDLPPDAPRARQWFFRGEDKSPTRLKNLRMQIDQLAVEKVSWLPYGPDPSSTCMRTRFTGWIRYREIIEPYQPGRVLRQVGYMQVVPDEILLPMKVLRPWKTVNYTLDFVDAWGISHWRGFPHMGCYLLNDHQLATDNPAACADDYMAWYFVHSHPLLILQTEEEGYVNHSDPEYWFNRCQNQLKNAIGWIYARDPEYGATLQEEMKRLMHDMRLSN